MSMNNWTSSCTWACTMYIVHTKNTRTWTRKNALACTRTCAWKCTSHEYVLEFACTYCRHKRLSSNTFFYKKRYDNSVSQWFLLIFKPKQFVKYSLGIVDFLRQTTVGSFLAGSANNLIYWRHGSIIAVRREIFSPPPPWYYN